jgi:hypothetical protein
VTETVDVGRITITYELDPEGDMLTDVIVDGDPPLIVVLGLLRLAEDTLLQRAADDEVDP